MRGEDKLLQTVRGDPLIARQARIALATGCPVIVTLPPVRPGRSAALAGVAARQVIVTEAAEGIAASIRAGVAAAGNGSVLLLLADLPDITTRDLHRLIERHRSAPDLILRATAADGTPGHPVLFPARYLPQLARLQGDTGARDMLARHARQTEFIALPARHAVTDLDTPEDWAAWRAGQS